MNPYQGIVHMNIQTDGPSKILYDPDNFTHQFTWVQLPPGTQSLAPLYGILPGHSLSLQYVYIYDILIPYDVTIYVIIITIS